LSSQLKDRIKIAKSFPPLSVHEEKLVKMALDDNNDEETVLSEGFNMKLTKGDISRLQDMEWLNDEVINFYVNVLMERNNKTPSYPKCHIFNTFFYPMLAERGYERVKKWTRKVWFNLKKISNY
jgi:Ulp1 family protease